VDEAFFLLIAPGKPDFFFLPTATAGGGGEASVLAGGVPFFRPPLVSVSLSPQLVVPILGDVAHPGKGLIP